MALMIYPNYHHFKFLHLLSIQFTVPDLNLKRETFELSASWITNEVPKPSP
jgi:hypothetical protein